jgi:hypothetical protein
MSVNPSSLFMGWCYALSANLASIDRSGSAARGLRPAR